MTSKPSIAAESESAGLPEVQINVVWSSPGAEGEQVEENEFRGPLTEGRATGIPKILRAMRDNGSPAPVFESDEDRTWFLVRLPVHEGVQPEPPEQATIQATLHESPQVTPQVTQLVDVLTREMSRGELQAAINLKDRKHFAADYLQPALDMGLVEMNRPDKPTSSRQRYRRTAVGEALAGTIANENSSTQATPQVAPQATPQVARLVAALSKEMSRAELQAALGLRDRSHLTAGYLQPALDSGLIEMTRPDKPTSSQQRYRRTSAGEALAQKIKELEPST